MCAVPNMAVFCSSLTSCFPGMLRIIIIIIIIIIIQKLRLFLVTMKPCITGSATSRYVATMSSALRRALWL